MLWTMDDEDVIWERCAQSCAPWVANAAQADLFSIGWVEPLVGGEDAVRNYNQKQVPKGSF